MTAATTPGPCVFPRCVKGEQPSYCGHDCDVREKPYEHEYGTPADGLAASSPEFGTSGTEKSERTAFLQDNADKSQAFPQSAASVPAEAHALTLFRILKNGEGRTYSATTFPNAPYAGCERTIRMARAVGWIAEGEGSYGLLEVLDTNGDILADFDIPTARAFAGLKKQLEIVVEEVEACV